MMGLQPCYEMPTETGLFISPDTVYAIVRSQYEGEYSGPSQELIGVAESKESAIKVIETLSGSKARDHDFNKGEFEAGDLYETRFIAMPARKITI